MLGIDYHHRLSVAEAASFCQRCRRGTLDFLEEPIRDETPEAYESLRTHDRRALRHRRGVLAASGSSCPTSSAASPTSSARHLQRRRLHRGDEGRRLGEAHYIDLMPHNPLGPICTAAIGAPGGGRAELRLAGMRTAPTEKLGFDDREFFPVQLKLDGPATSCPTAPGWASSSTRSCRQAGVQVLGSAASAPQGWLLYQLVSGPGRRGMVDGCGRGWNLFPSRSEFQSQGFQSEPS